MNSILRVQIDVLRTLIQYPTLNILRPPIETMNGDLLRTLPDHVLTTKVFTYFGFKDYALTVVLLNMHKHIGKRQIGEIHCHCMSHVPTWKCANVD